MIDRRFYTGKVGAEHVAVLKTRKYYCYLNKLIVCGACLEVHPFRDAERSGNFSTHWAWELIKTRKKCYVCLEQARLEWVDSL